MLSWFKFDSALHYYTESLKMDTFIKDSIEIVCSLTNIGNGYYYQHNFEQIDDVTVLAINI